MQREQIPVTQAGVRTLVASLRKRHAACTEASFKSELLEALETLEYYMQTTQSFESALRAEQGILFEDGYCVNVAALVDGLVEVRRADATGGPFAKIASDALQLSGGGKEFLDAVPAPLEIAAPIAG